MNPEQPRKICPACRTVNRPDCRFCTGCGIAFPQERICTHCNAPLSGSEKFCQTCGVPSDEAVSRNSHRDQKKFCHQCRALINHDAKFCNMCGTVISQLPVCPRCGDPIGPDEKFCGVCGLPFGTTTPVREEPAKTVQPAPPQSHYQPEIPPASAKKGGIPFGKIVIGVIILLVVLAGIIMILPDSPPPPPPAGGGTVTAGIQVRTGEDPAATQVAVDASNAVVKGVAEVSCRWRFGRLCKSSRSRRPGSA